MKKRILVFAILIAILFVLTGCNDESNSPSEANPTEPAVTSEDSAAGSEEPAGEVNISIVPPEGWEPVEGSVLQVQYLKGTASFMVKDENFSGDTLDAVVVEAKEIFTGSFDNVEYLGEPEYITVDGKDGVKLLFTCEIGSMKMKYEYVYLFAGNDVYAITFGDLADNFDKLSADYEAILVAIKFE